MVARGRQPTISNRSNGNQFWLSFRRWRIRAVGADVLEQLCGGGFRLHVELEEVTPAVWRRILVPGSVRLDRLADMLIAAMGWSNSHLHCFEVGDVRYGMHFDDYPEGEVDETTVTVHQALRDTTFFTFEYDFGDGWGHLVKVEARLTSTVGLKSAVCLAGENACPPDDCGGPGGYEQMLDALADPMHEEHLDYVNWVGDASFDRTAFDIVEANAMLQKIRSRPRRP